MDRNEFVTVLREALTGEVSDAVVADNVRYYQNYIAQEMAAGKSEAEVLELLGDPRLIAKTIVDTQGQSGQTYYDTYESGSYSQESTGSQMPRAHHWLNTWYGQLLIWVILIMVLMLVFTVVGGILSWILPVLFPVLMILWVIRLFGRNR